MNLDSFHNEQLRIDYLKDQNNLIHKFIGDIADYAEKSTNPAAERSGYGCFGKVFDSGYIPLVPPQAAGVCTLRKQSTDLAWPNYDGINPEKYGRSKYRICWVLKEAYDPDGKENEGGGTTWHEIFAEKTFNGKGQTWRPMTYITYSLLHDFPSYSLLEEFSSQNGGKALTEMATVFQEIAYININKMPGGKKTAVSKSLEDYNFWKPVLLWQLEAYDPQIVIFAIPEEVFFKFSIDLGLKEHGEKWNANDPTEWCNDIYYIVKNHKLYLNVWHPSDHYHKLPNYEQNIIDCLRRVHTPAACGGTKGMYPESNTLPKQPYPDRSAAGLVDLVKAHIEKGIFL